jgi:hypothetical protein
LEEAHLLGHLESLENLCEFYAAFHFADEQVLPHRKFPACCVLGDGQLDPLQATPIELRRLLESDCQRGRSFRKDIRKYNSALAFTSISYSKDERLSLRGGIQCFQIHRELFHLQGPLWTETGLTPAFAQLFFYDPEYATDIRIDRYPTLDRSILTELLAMLTDHNPFIGVYKTARERLAEPTSSQFRLLLNP